jgi:hypothetical protein
MNNISDFDPTNLSILALVECRDRKKNAPQGRGARNREAYPSATEQGYRSSPLRRG